MSEAKMMSVSGGRRPTNKWLALATACVGTLMSTLNSSIITIANPVLAQEFAVSMAQIQWVTTIYLIVTSSLMLMFGRLGDRIGAHKVYIAGIATFTLGSLACSLGDAYLPLLLARALQGLGAALTVSTSMGLVATIFPQEQRGKAMGITVLMVGLGNVAGPALGGIILANATWHLIFLVNVPAGLIAFVMAAVWLRSPLPTNPQARLDALGSALLAATISCLIIFLSGGFVGAQWFGLGFVLFAVAFIGVERRSKAPLLEFSLFQNRRFALGNLITFLSYCAYMMMVFQLPFFLETVWGTPVGVAGMLMMVGALCMAISGPVSGFASDRFGALQVMPLALAGIVACIVLTLFLGTDEAIWMFVVAMVLSGLGMGFLNTPNNSDIMTAAGRQFASYASGFVGTNRNLAFCIGTALSAGVFALAGSFAADFADSFGTSGGAGAVAMEHLFALKIVLAVCLALVLTSLALCLYLRHASK